MVVVAVNAVNNTPLQTVTVTVTFNNPSSIIAFVTSMYLASKGADVLVSVVPRHHLLVKSVKHTH